MERFVQQVVDLIASAKKELATRMDAFEHRLAGVRDGRDGVDGKDGAPGRDGVDGKDGRDGIDGKDGAEGTKGLDGANGKDGAPGRDGIDGKDGRDGLPGQPGRDGTKGVDGADGRDGKDGADGLGFGELEATYDGERTFTLRAVSGERVKDLGTWKMPIVIDRGVYSPTMVYEKGDGVSRGGSFWIAKQDAPAGQMPDTNAGAAFWRLAVKAGRDGKEGKVGPQGERGARGEKGDDGRNAY